MSPILFLQAGHWPWEKMQAVMHLLQKTCPHTVETSWPLLLMAEKESRQTGHWGPPVCGLAVLVLATEGGPGESVRSISSSPKVSLAPAASETGGELSNLNSILMSF